MSTNPASINYRDEDLQYEGNAAARQQALSEALKASTGDAGVTQGDKAKRAVVEGPKG